MLLQNRRTRDSIEGYTVEEYPVKSRVSQRIKRSKEHGSNINNALASIMNSGDESLKREMRILLQKTSNKELKSLARMYSGALYYPQYIEIPIETLSLNNTITEMNNAVVVISPESNIEPVRLLNKFSVLLRQDQNKGPITSRMYLKLRVAELIFNALSSYPIEEIEIGFIIEDEKDDIKYYTTIKIFGSHIVDFRNQKISGPITIKRASRFVLDGIREGSSKAGNQVEIITYTFSPPGSYYNIQLDRLNTLDWNPWSRSRQFRDFLSIDVWNRNIPVVPMSRSIYNFLTLDREILGRLKLTREEFQSSDLKSMPYLSDMYEVKTMLKYRVVNPQMFTRVVVSHIISSMNIALLDLPGAENLYITVAMEDTLNIKDLFTKRAYSDRKKLMDSEGVTSMYSKSGTGISMDYMRVIIERVLLPTLSGDTSSLIWSLEPRCFVDILEPQRNYL